MLLALLLFLCLLPYFSWLVFCLYSPNASLFGSYIASSPLLFLAIISAARARSRRSKLRSQNPPDDLLYRFQNWRDRVGARDAKLLYLEDKGVKGPAIKPLRDSVLALKEHLIDTPETEQDFAIAYACICTRERAKKNKYAALWTVPTVIIAVSLAGAAGGAVVLIAYLGVLLVGTIYAMTARNEELKRCLEAADRISNPEAAVSYLSRYHVNGQPQKALLINRIQRQYGLQLTTFTTQVQLRKAAVNQLILSVIAFACGVIVFWRPHRDPGGWLLASFFLCLATSLLVRDARRLAKSYKRTKNS
jgi:hypothetical protein